MFIVQWIYNESGTDFAFFGPFDSYSHAELWAESRKGFVVGRFEVFEVHNAAKHPKAKRKC